MRKIILSFIFCIILSANCYSQSGWRKQTIGYSYDSFNTLYFFNNNTGYAISGIAGMPGYYGRLFMTINGGQNWTFTNFTNPDLFLDGYYFNPQNFILVGQRGISPGIIAIWSNNVRYDVIIPPLSGYTMTSLTATNWLNIDTGFVSGWDLQPGHWGRVLKTLNKGLNWIEITPTVSSDINNLKFINYNTGYIIDGAYLLKTTNSGINWIQLSSVLLTQQGLRLTSPDTFYVCGYTGNVRISVDSGHTWQSRPVGYNVFLRTSNFLNSKTGWVCGDSGYIFRTTNAGINWQKQISGTLTHLYKINIIDENNLWIGSDSGIVLNTTTGGVTYVRSGNNEITNSFKLFQNYPNPFNQTSIIKFQCSMNSYITLKIFDVLGREKQTLINNKLDVGMHEVIFDGFNLSSGIYYYSLFINEKKFQTKKMIYLK